MFTRRAFLVAVPASGLAACAAKGPAPSFPPFHVGDGPLRLNVARIAVEDRSSLLGAGHIEGEFDVSPLTALNNWIGDRLDAAGSSGILTVTVRDASAIEERLETTGGVSGLFKDEPGAKVTARLRVDFTADDPDRLVTARSSVAVERFTTVPKDVDFTERRQLLYSLSKGLIEDFDRKAMVSIPQYFGAFLG
ncbi:MAG: hypothetical protein PHS60_03950 [Zavarzinia sp.]|nr:hypothetical protein [Zavarzinia sp.]